MFPLLVSLVAFAPTGEIFGDIREGETYLAEVPVVLACGAEKVDGTTDKQGSFRLKTAGSGKCTLTLTWKKQSPSVDVVVFERPTRYRLIVEEVGGKLVLKRV
ncbi:MAG TPA: hypothetical protein VJU15_07325 [Gemmatimonadales bacterium]|nr:hypothetical protein [Gemmatimonadales bacterium]